MVSLLMFAVFLMNYVALNSDGKTLNYTKFLVPYTFGVLRYPGICARQINMSTSKVIFTYKRKRLSSCSGASNADVCPSFSSDMHTGKNQATHKESSEKDPKISEDVNINDTDCSVDCESCPEPSSQRVDSNLQENAQTQSSEVCHTRDIKRKSTDMSEDNNCKTSGKNIFPEVTAQETTKASCLDRSNEGGLVTVQEDLNSLTKHKFTSSLEVFKSKLNAPLLTFSRRLKKKAGEGISATSKEGDVAAGEKSPTVKVATDGINTESCARVSVAKQSASLLSGADALETNNPPKDKGLQSSDGEVSSCDDIGKTDGQHVSHRCRSSSGDSQLTSSYCADVKAFAEKAIQPTASSATLDLSAPPSGAFVIDCNVIPDCDDQEKESDIVGSKSGENYPALSPFSHGQGCVKPGIVLQNSSAVAENRRKITQDRRKGLELFGDTDLRVTESVSSDAARIQKDLDSQVMTENKRESKYLQLFSDGRSDHLAPSSNNLEPCFNVRPEQGSMYEGQTSRHGSGVREFIQSPLMFQHNVYPDTCNTRATALRGNRNIFMDRFDLGRAAWSEEELDSLWIGIRRHGRGNWHAMLLDPRLRFAPWRVARDLAMQWDREQCNLFSGPRIPERRRFEHPRVRDSSETRLSLGDVYARKDGAYFGQNQSHIHVTLGSNPFNPVPTGVMIGGDGFGLGLNSYMPHWLRDPVGPTSGYLNLSVPMSTMPPSGPPPQLVRPFSNHSGASPGVNGPSTRKQIVSENVIVIDSDASSEETISDDHNPRN